MREKFPDTEFFLVLFLVLSNTQPGEIFTHLYILNSSVILTKLSLYLSEISEFFLKTLLYRQKVHR